MTLFEIKCAVDSGRTVHWASDLYTVVHDDKGRWLIVCTANGSAIGLTWADGVTMNGDESQFYIKPQRIRYVCNQCGDNALVFSANSYWNEEDQKFDHNEDESDPYCPTCQEEVDFTEEVI